MRISDWSSDVCSSDLKIGDIAATGTRIQDAIAFNGSGRSHGAPFTVSGRLTSPNETVVGGRNSLVMRIATGSSAIGVAGTLPGATEFDGADLRLSARGRTLHTPFRMPGVGRADERSVGEAGGRTIGSGGLSAPLTHKN